MTKKTKHPRVCKICQKGIGSKERYARLTDYNEGREISTGFYHYKCFKEKFMNFEKLQTEASSILGNARGLLAGLGSKI